MAVPDRRQQRRRASVSTVLAPARALLALVSEVHRGSHVVYRNDNPAADPRRVVLFGDSFANFVWDTASGMLTGLLAETFREVHFMWTASMDWTYVEAVRPDVVVTEIAERFARMLPPYDLPQTVLEQRMRELKFH